MCRPLIPGLVLALGLAACATAPEREGGVEPMSERTLAARKLQKPLTEVQCRAAVYPALGRDWPAESRVPVVGRGPSFAAALEALCREADGVQASAVGDLSYRAPVGWGPSHEVRGTALRFSTGFSAPAAPERAALSPPPPLRPGEEPPPASER